MPRLVRLDAPAALSASGAFLRLDSPEEFHASFRIVEPFHHHPHGMRRPDGTEVPAA